MATLDEVLANLGYMEDSIQFIINEDLRTISVPANGVIAGVVGDKNINRINFQMPRMYNGFDMSTFETRINYETPNGQKNYYTVNDVVVNGNTIMFTWLIDSDVTRLNGAVNFVVKMLKTVNGTITQSFSTTLANIRVIDGLEVDDQIAPEEITDMLNKVKAEVYGYVADAVPDEYTDLVDRVNAISDTYLNLDTQCEALDSVNLDDYKTAGTYKVTSVEIAKTIQNIPDSIAGRLIVMVTTVKDRVVQLYVTNSTQLPKVYIRYFNGTSWTSWDSFGSGKIVNELSKVTIKASDVLITSDNYTKYFSDYNDIPVNSVYSIAYGVPLLNAPPGNKTLNAEGTTRGYPAGTIITLCGSGSETRGVVQIFTTAVASNSQSFLCFRTATASGNTLTWYPWQKISNATNLSAADIVIRKETASQFFTDLNDAPINSIYQINGNCDEGTLLHHPNPGNSSVLVTLGFSPTTRHGMVQLCFGTMSGGKHGMWYRYGYLHSSDDHRWTEWNKTGGITDSDYAALVDRHQSLSESVNTISEQINDITDKYLNLDTQCEALDSVNIDDYKTAGTYKVTSVEIAKTIQNIPESIAGRLIVMVTTVKDRVVQLYVTNSTQLPKVYIRYFNGTSWTSWDSFGSGRTVDNLSAVAVKASESLITPDNYTEYFTDYNDIPVNSVYSIAYGVPLLNSPPGNKTLNREGDTRGYPAGTVVTLCSSSSSARSVMQIFTTAVASNSQSFLCFRTATVSDNTLTWYPWQKISNATSLSAADIVIRKETASQFFTDLNDAPVNSIYQIDLNCDEGTLLNHPNAGNSSILVTLGFSPTSRHGMVQLCFGLLGGGEHGMWYRYGYKNGTDDYRWTEWNKSGITNYDAYMMNKGRLPNNTDLNTIEENSIYLLSGGGGYSNIPSSSGTGFLTSKTVDGITLQVYEKFSGNRWSRYKTASSEWSEWIEK